MPTRMSLALAVLLPVLAACGGGGGGGGSSGPPKEKGFRILQTSPADHEYAVARDSTVVAEFSEDLDTGTVVAESFQVTEAFSGRVVRGTLAVDDDHRTVRLVPSEILAKDTEYRVLATTDIESRFGERMKKDHESSFHTVVTDSEIPPPPPPPPAGRLEVVGSMHEGRSSHTSTLLPTGGVLVTGGYRISTEITNSAEVYDPTTKSFSQLLTGMRVARANHTATLLTDGTVLIAGGLIENGAKVADSTEIYDPTTQKFSVGPDMTQARCYHTATPLADGTVLFVGGGEMNASGRLVSTRSAEIYDPTTGSFTALPNMDVYRSDHQATRLEDGRVLVTGGSYTSTIAELYDPAKRSFSATNGQMVVARSGHTATRLFGGTVLLTGGGSRSASIYSPGTSKFDSTLGVPLVDRTSHSADILTSGRVLIVGGYTWVPNLTFHQTIEYFNGPPGQNTFVMFQGLLSYPRVLHRTTVLKSGDVLITGGVNLDPQQSEVAVAALFTFK